ncbi:MAG: N(4)-(beta-N-acetylglucosaminyl)-L-asparaginase [Bryobacterales bacterium]|jgi:N4-(beta-N-acetylglucosaminyl)-L-asparaginase|nr:N(4)-(beta-N-acetylglucosaminyl)-L-asparaginase [Bryobacterales bacterium]
MQKLRLTRRSWLAGSAGLAAAQPGSAKTIAVASNNGLGACARAVEMMRAGQDTLDAVIAGVNLVEEDPNDTSVGYGGLPNEEGVVELDACVMHGPTRRAGAVASIRNIKYPSRVAKLVMEQTDHILLAGEGALRFARAHGFEEENLLTERARLAWMLWKRSLRDGRGHNNWMPGMDAPDSGPAARLGDLFPQADEETLAWASDVVRHPPTGTINCLGLNAKGEISGCTTTSGLAWKIAGRVGDSPIIAAGLFVDQDVGGAGSTGRGEENIRVAGGHTVVEAMRQGRSPTEACLEALRRVARNYNHDEKKLARFDLSFYALRKDGVYGSASLWKESSAGQRRQFAVNDGGPSRHEPCAFLLEGRR